MPSQEKTLELLIEIGNPADRRTRTGLLERALHSALTLTEADAVVILTPSSRRGERFMLHAGSPAHALLPPPPQSSEVVRRFAECCQPLALPDLSAEEALMAADGCPGVEAGPVLFVPLRRRDPLFGYVAVYRRRGRARFALNETRLMLLLAAWLSTALETLRLSSGIERTAITDDLTEVYNGRFLRSALPREIRRASRYGQELSIVRIDVDNLGAFSDQHGELQGNLLLRDVAAVLAQQVRSFDLLARYGSDKFMLVLPQTGREGAVEVAERMRAAVEQHTFPVAAAGGITVSLGVASCPQEGSDSRALVSAADRALSQAQERGRNRVETLVNRAA